ncbi:EDD domain protein, DegV family [Lachnospiraceae bacterium]|nr:EDD domain protein, DegV family [Lachnospiraceae bacterium]
MKKVAIVTDTNSGMTIAEGEKKGIFVLPMPVIINDKEYLDNVNLTHDEFYNFLAEDAGVHTSQPAAGDVMGLWDKILEEGYDEIVHIPMSSGLSGSCANASVYANEYEGKVHVVNNQRISVTERQSVLDAKVLADSGKSAEEIKNILEETKFDSSIYITLDTLEYLKKGGRITPAAAAFAKILNLKPILQIQGEKLDAFSKCRGIKQAKSIMIKAVKNDIDTRFGGYDPENPNVWIQMAYSQNEEAANEFAAEVREAFPNCKLHIDRLPLSIACHIGPGSLALACSKVVPGGVTYASSED